MGVRILTNRLFVLPTNASLDALREVFTSSPIEIKWDGLAVEVGSSHRSEIELHEDVEYRALTHNLDVWYDSALGRSSLLISLIPSPEMVYRHNEVGDAWGRPLFFPFISMTDDPVLRRNRRAFLNSLSTRFVDFPLMLTFHNETVITDNSVAPAHNDFYQNCEAKGTQHIKAF